MKGVMLALAAALAAVLVAVPGASARDFTVRAGGLVFDNPSGGTVQTLGKFEINLRAGPTQKVTYVDRTTGVSFHSTQLMQLYFTASSVKILGIGMANGKRVHFTVIATDHPAATDAFRIAWNHQAAHGGNVLEGNVHVRQIKLS
jgi:hypothetical protein